MWNAVSSNVCGVIPGVIRFIRRKSVLGIIFFLSLTYFLFNLDHHVRVLSWCILCCALHYFLGRPVYRLGTGDTKRTPNDLENSTGGPLFAQNK